MPADTPDMVLVPPTEDMVAAGAAVIHRSPLIEAKLSPLSWMGLSRAVLEAALSASPLGASGEGALRPASRSSVPTEQAGGPVVAFGHFQRGAQACREMMARFVEATHPEIAQSIRLNWHPGWGNDPGRPPVVVATWEPEECPEGEAARKALEDTDEPGPDDLELTARMLETWGPVVEPASPDGKVSFTRAMMDSAAIAIRRTLSAPSTTSTAEQVGCPVCGCEERTGAGYLQCECPAPNPPGEVAWAVRPVGSKAWEFWSSEPAYGDEHGADGWEVRRLVLGGTRPTPATPEGLREIEARLRECLAEIADMTDPDNPGSYRADDREGCLDAVHVVALAALQPQAQGGE